jgi:hypothetical protein
MLLNTQTVFGQLHIKVTVVRLLKSKFQAIKNKKWWKRSWSMLNGDNANLPARPFYPVKSISSSLDMKLYELQWMSESYGDKISISAESRNPIY